MPLPLYFLCSSGINVARLCLPNWREATVKSTDGNWECWGLWEKRHVKICLLTRVLIKYTGIHIIYPKNYTNSSRRVVFCCGFLIVEFIHIHIRLLHYSDVIMGAMASQITSLTIVYPTVYSGADQRKHHSSASLAFVRVIHRSPVYSPHKEPVTRKMFPFDDVIMLHWHCCIHSRLP